MIDINNFPTFTYFIKCYIFGGEEGLICEAKCFVTKEPHETRRRLKAEIDELNRHELWEIQQFLIRNFRLRIRQNEWQKWYKTLNQYIK